jgi:CubicO group peptidase (beta-lactamase class C family)
MPLTRPAVLLSALAFTLTFIATLTACEAPSRSARDGADFAPSLATLDQDQDKTLQGVVVWRDGRIVAERYYNGATPTSLNDIRSAGKSVTALLATIAMDRGAIASASDPVRKYWPEAAGSALGAATVDDLLTMRSGLAADDEDPRSPGIEDHMDEAADPVAFALSTPRQDAPGTTYRYNSLTAYAAGIVVGKATGTDLGAFAGPALFEPLGITAWRWSKDTAGHTKGQGNLWLSTRSLASIGEMVRCGGEYRGRRLVSASGIEALLRPRVAIADKDPFADQYARLWYFKALPVDDSRLPVWFASGNGGNKIYIVPHLRMVVAITSQAYGRGYGQRRSQDILIGLIRVALAHQGQGGVSRATAGPFDPHCGR